MPSDTREPWVPKAYPACADAARAVTDWLGSGGGSALHAAGLDLRGADFSAGDFRQARFDEAVLDGVSLAGADLYRAGLPHASCRNADFSDACLVRAELDEADLRGCRLDRADMVKASVCDVDARGASLRGTRVMGASLLGVDLRGADLSYAVVRDNSFKVTVDDTTVVEGLTGTVFGPVTVQEQAGTLVLSGRDVEGWFAERGARIEMLTPARSPLHTARPRRR